MVFLFKQKTAYEMRISDWSSDVCSSDLPGDTLMALLTEAGADPGESQAAISALADKFNPRKLKVGQEITLTFERNDADSYRLFELSLSPSVEREEIGRASCRERVCQYV